MNKIDRMIHQFDAYVDKKVGPWWKNWRRYFSIFSSIFLLLLLIVVLVRMFYVRPYHLSKVMNNDLGLIERIFEDIDKECNILSIRKYGATIDFLTVARFAGSSVGCLNLAYPKHWNGPYLNRTPSIQGRPYQIVQTQEGHFVVPGDGVKLPNGKIIGKDIIFNADTVISEMIKPDGELCHNKQPLALKLKFKVGDWDNPVAKEDKDDEDVSAILKEFDAAFPYSWNEIEWFKRQDQRSCV
ncbi:MAG: hypothetical protein H6679_03010 [Epsilonproteobacteria bacterium]|nr:hypothetical protein [Campylobacterota bacterium]